MIRVRSVVAMALLAAACSGPAVQPAGGPSTPNVPSANALTPSVAPTTAATALSSALLPDLLNIPDFGEIEPGTYFITPGTDENATLRVQITINGSGWQRFLGAFKAEGAREAGHRYVGVDFFDVINVVTDACKDHSPLNPPIGPTVDDLATAAAHISPFEVTSPPTPVTAYGHTGEYLKLTVPDIPHVIGDSSTAFTGCRDAELKTWIAPPLSYAFYGYYGPGQVEELWILDVDGHRLMISARSHPDSPPSDVAEMRAMLDSIVIQP